MKREYIVAYDEADADGIYFSHPIGELGQEIVRCKECKYGEIWTDGVYTNINCINGVIGGYGAELDLDDFCSYGSRSERSE